MKLAVAGAGAWGTALAISLSARHELSLWVRRDEQASILARERENTRYLSGARIPDAVRIDSDSAILHASDAIVCAVPVAGLRELTQRLHGTSANGIWTALKGQGWLQTGYPAPGRTV